MKKIPFAIKDLQKEIGEWSRHNFGDQPSWRPLLGIVEEVGELSHAYLKREQGIRGTADEHIVAAQDAVGDIFIYLADFCSREGWDMDEIIRETWVQVSKRNWKENAKDGTATGT